MCVCVGGGGYFLNIFGVLFAVFFIIFILAVENVKFVDAIFSLICVVYVVVCNQVD